MAGKAQRFRDGETVSAPGIQVGAMLSPYSELVFRRMMSLGKWHPIPNQDREVSFQAENIVLMLQAVSSEHRWSAFPVEFK
jgi:hypothetical protein